MFKKAVLLVHGFAGGIYDIEYLANYLELSEKFDTFTFTLPGHEQMVIMKATKRDWIEAAEKEVEKLISHGYSTIYVIGHSMGGVIATHLATKYPQIKKLVLLAPAFNYFSFTGDKFKIGNMSNMATSFKGYKLDLVVGRLIKAPATAIKNFVGLVKDHYDDPYDVTIPTLVYRGADDRVVPASSAEYVFSALKTKHKILITMKGVNHAVLINNRRDETCLIVKDFLVKPSWLITEKVFDI